MIYIYIYVYVYTYIEHIMDIKNINHTKRINHILLNILNVLYYILQLTNIYIYIKY